MLIRIVKLSFKDEKIADFIQHFNSNKEKIRSFKGCRYLELNRVKETTVFFTYSHWDSEQSLENYRNSALFKTVWEKTKPWFSSTPEAWSLEQIENLP